MDKLTVERLLKLKRELEEVDKLGVFHISQKESGGIKLSRKTFEEMFNEYEVEHCINCECKKFAFVDGVEFFCSYYAISIDVVREQIERKRKC